MTENTGREPVADNSSVLEVVDRALAKQKNDAAREVEAILDAALTIAEQSAPSSPRVSDIVKEAGISNQAFYRYFSGKDDLMKTVFERGISRLHSYLAYQMSKETDPHARVAAWIRGILAQVTDQTAVRQSSAINQQLGRLGGDDGIAMTALGELLVEPLIELNSSTPAFDAAIIRESAVGTMRRHFINGTVPSDDEREHAVAFCLRGMSTGV